MEPDVKGNSLPESRIDLSSLDSEKECSAHPLK
jgi:hypothetical protein